MSEPIYPAAPALPGSERGYGPHSGTMALTSPPWATAALPPTQINVNMGSGRRFAALSTLPEGRRLPARRDVPLAKHLRQESNLPDAPLTDLSASPPPGPAPLLLPSAECRQLGFNCPACFAVLIIKDPATYNGCPAPCPTCGTRIQPPQCVPESPFSIVHRTGPVILPHAERLEQGTVSHGAPAAAAGCLAKVITAEKPPL